MGAGLWIRIGGRGLGKLLEALPSVPNIEGEILDSKAHLAAVPEDKVHVVRDQVLYGGKEL
jgi:hypothetical protein